MRSCPNCTGHIMGDRPGRNCSTTYACSDGVSPPFNAALNAAFPGAWAARAGKTVLAGGTDAMHAGFYPGQANYIPFNASAYALSALLGSWLPPRGFDGIYLDGYGMLQLSDSRRSAASIGTATACPSRRSRRSTSTMRGRPSSSRAYAPSSRQGLAGARRSSSPMRVAADVEPVTSSPSHLPLLSGRRHVYTHIIR